MNDHSVIPADVCSHPSKFLAASAGTKATMDRPRQVCIECLLCQTYWWLDLTPGYGRMQIPPLLPAAPEAVNA